MQPSRDISRLIEIMAALKMIVYLDRSGFAERVKKNQGMVNPNLVSAFYRHAVVNPERLALAVGGRSYSYGELAGISQQVACLLGRPARVGVLASRTLEAYAGVLGTLWAGAPNIPDKRLIQILRITLLDAIVAEAAGWSGYRGGSPSSRLL